LTSTSPMTYHGHTFPHAQHVSAPTQTMDTSLTNEQLWQSVQTHLQLSVSAAVYKTWFSRTTCLECGDSYIMIGCPNNFTLRQLETKYQSQINAALKDILGREMDIQFSVIEERAESVAGTPLFDELPNLSQTGNVEAQESAPPTSSTPTVSALNPHYTFDQFVVGNTNRIAHAAALAVTDSPGKNYNPLFLHGGTGVGKTHLVQAIGNALIAKNPRTKVLYCSIERFMNDFIDSLRFKTTNEFKKQYRSCDVLIVDDIQFIAGNKGSTQEEFFHTFNELHASGRQIILCSDRPPREIATLADRLTSRFEGGLTVDIAAPDFETRSAIIRAKADRLNLELVPEVADYIASIDAENIRSIEGMILKIQSYVFSTNQTLTLSVVQSLVGASSPSPAPTHRSNPNDLLKLICETFGITQKEILSKKRTQTLVVPRQIAMYLFRQDLGLNLETIGQILGGRDHTTVMHGIDKVTKLLATDQQTRSTLTALRQSAG
jgi:chromosomal replication initiator protein